MLFGPSGGAADANEIEYITNGKFESDVSGWSTYADAAGVQPVDGTGGTPNITLTRTTSTPLVGAGSGLITKDAVNRQGEGISDDFTIDEGYKSKVLTISMLYSASANFAYNAGTAADPSDITVYIYDVTNAVLIQPTGFTLDGSGSFSAQFQAASDSDSYRLIYHISTTNASAWTFKVDSVSVGPREVAKGPIITDWVEYTPTFTGFGTVSVSSMYWKREGGDILIRGRFTSGTPTATEARMSLPSGLTSASTTTTLAVIGGAERSTGASTTYFHTSVLIEPSVSYVTFGQQSSTVNALSKANGNGVVATSDVVSLTSVRMPIAGWGSNTVTSSDAGLRSVVFSGTQTSEAVTASSTDIDFTAEKDSHGGWSTDTYTIQESGDYELRGVAASTVTGTNLRVYKNGSASKFLAGSAFASGRYMSGSVIMPDLVAGDTLTIRATETATITNGSFSINKIQSPQTIGMNEFVGASYKTLSSTTLTTGTTIVHTTKIKDSHGAYNSSTGVFTCPVPGMYEIKQYGTYDASSSVNLRIEKNASDFFGYIISNVPANIRTKMSVEVPCEAGDTLEIVSGTNNTAGATDGVCSFTRIN